MLLKNKLLIGTMLLASLFGREAKAEEAVRLKQPSAIERTLREEISKPKIELNFNYKTGSEQKFLDYLTSKSTIYIDSSGDYVTSIRNFNVPELTLTQENQVNNIIKDIQNQNINSYQDLITASQNFSESQQLFLSSILGNLLYVFNYDIDSSSDEIVSQEEFFDNLQNSLISGNEIGFGECPHFATHIERILNNDFGLPSNSVSGISNNGIKHAYVISKIENGTAIIDSYNILIANTKNIEKILEAYQKSNGTTAFQHLFFEDTDFKCKLITNDGRNFLNFVEYDESSAPLKNALIQDFKPESYFKANINLEDYLTSLEFNYFGFFTKIGEIRGNANSPLHKASLAQIGFKRKFLTPYINNKFLNFVTGNKIIDLNTSFVYGGIFQDTEIKDGGIQGINSNLVVSPNNEKGFNLSSRIATNFIETKDSILFSDFAFGAGISYKLPIKKISIEPYSVSQFNLFKKNIEDIQDNGLYFSELIAGSVFDVKIPNKFSFSIDPYYLWRIWEQGFGGNIKLEGKNIGINAKADATWPNHEFCPDKVNVGAGLDLKLKNLNLGINYELKRTDYDDEIDNQHLFGLKGSVKLN